ncbi:MAG TPA: Clp1/GlmU family protein [Methylomirabilota bacterium]|nr:Clp1/GlmU family protein [Methylomirabilota bacterium]
MPIDPTWSEAVQRALVAKVTLIIGETDTGKTSFTTFLANSLVERGLRVGVVDADLGQSDIGPPTTVGLGLLTQPVERLGEAEVVGLHFVGSTSPQGNLLPTVIGTKKMVEKAIRLGLDTVLVDTSGLIQGELGRTLKQHKIDLIDPDLLLCLQHHGECEHIVKPYSLGTRPVVLRLAPAGVAKKRSQEERRLHRERTLQAYFHGARALNLDLSRVLLMQPALYIGQPLALRQLEELSGVLDEMVLWAERRGNELTVVTPDPLREPQIRQIQKRFGEHSLVNYSLDDFHNALAGLENSERETIGLGIVRAIDVSKQILTVETSVPESEIALVRIGHQKFRLP